MNPAKEAQVLKAQNAELQEAVKDLQAVVNDLGRDCNQFRYQFHRANRMLQEAQAEIAALKKAEAKEKATPRAGETPQA